MEVFLCSTFLSYFWIIEVSVLIFNTSTIFSFTRMELNLGFSGRKQTLFRKQKEGYCYYNHWSWSCSFMLNASYSGNLLVERLLQRNIWEEKRWMLSCQFDMSMLYWMLVFMTWGNTLWMVWISFFCFLIVCVLNLLIFLFIIHHLSY